MFLLVILTQPTVKINVREQNKWNSLSKTLINFSCQEKINIFTLTTLLNNLVSDIFFPICRHLNISEVRESGVLNIPNLH